VSGPDRDQWPASGRTPTTEDERRAQVAAARRGVATFGGEYRPGALTGSLRGFAHRYGWRAYALPLLVVVTVLALMTTSNGSGGGGSPAAAPSAPAPRATASGPSAPPTASGSIALKADRPGAGSQDKALSSVALPAGQTYTKRGAGTFRILKGHSKAVGKGKLFRYSIDVEKGLSGIDLNAYAATVQRVLSDPRSWAGHGVSVQRVDSGRIDFHVTLVSSYTVRDMCGYEIKVETSCYLRAGANSAAKVNRAVINNSRWVRGAAAYIGDVGAYREYLINHEVGHALGHQHAHACLPSGQAPAMMEQTVGLMSAATHKLCEANPWPYPPGAKGAPGKEAPDTPQNSEFNLNGE
jgi:hypothetical protein